MVRTRFTQNRRESSVWKLTPSRRKQRTTMKACLLTVTKCHKKAQSHRAPARAPTSVLPHPPSLVPHPRARHPPTASAPPPHIIHTFKLTFKCATTFPPQRDSPHTHGSHVTDSHTVTLPLVNTTSSSTHNRQHKSIEHRRKPHAIIRFNGGCLLTFPPHQKLELREMLGVPAAKIHRQSHPANKLALLAPAHDPSNGTRRLLARRQQTNVRLQRILRHLLQARHVDWQHVVERHITHRQLDGVLVSAYSVDTL